MGTNYSNLSFLERATIRMTQWMGSTTSIIVHTLAFIGIWGLLFLGLKFEQVMLILTTVLSLEAIYLALFIQMTVNRNTESLEDVEEDVDDLESNLKKIHKNVSSLAEDVDEIQEDVDEIAEDVDEIQEDIDEISEDELKAQTLQKSLDQTNASLQDLQSQVQHLTQVITNLESKLQPKP